MSEMITEYRNENTKDIDLLSTIDIVRKINEEDKLVALAIEDETPNIAKAIDMIAKQFLMGGKLYYFGAGTSGRIGILDASECPPTFGVPADMVTGIIAGGDKAIRTAVEGAEDNFELGEEDAKILTDQDVCVVISASGNPKYLLGVLAQADRVNCRTIALTCNHKALILEDYRAVVARRMHYSFCFSERHCRGLSPCTGIVASVAGRAFRTGSNGSPARVEEIHRCHVERRVARTCTFRSVELFSGSDHQPFPS